MKMWMAFGKLLLVRTLDSPRDCRGATYPVLPKASQTRLEAPPGTPTPLLCRLSLLWWFAKSRRGEGSTSEGGRIEGGGSGVVDPTAKTRSDRSRREEGETPRSSCPFSFLLSSLHGRQEYDHTDTSTSLICVAPQDTSGSALHIQLSRLIHTR